MSTMPSAPFARTDALGRPNFYHPISGALFVPDYFHQFLLPTIPELSVLPMQPLNWRFGVRPDRPFDITAGYCRHRSQNQPVSIPRLPASQQQYPTAYYLEQLQFYQDGPLPKEPDPEEEPAPDLSRAWFVEAFCFVTLNVGAVVKTLFAAILAVFATGKMMWRRFLKERTWEFVVSALVATQIVRILPRIGGILNSIGGGRTEPPPLYVMMIPNRNQWSRLSYDPWIFEIYG